jgi:dTDP-3-amino-3,4,6-trideoxy-alpha-D-glucose transaminase
MVLLNDFARQWSDVRRDVAAALEKVGTSGTYILGPSVTEFERQLSSRLGVREAVGVGNGLDALEIALRAVGCKPGDRVLTTPMSAFATTLAIMRVGAVPCFVDVDETGLLDLDLVEEALTRTPSIPFVLPVHLYGRSLDLRRLGSVAARLGVCVIEDCAQAIGATHAGLLAGTVGAAAALSFYPTKNLGCLGDGGALLTNSSEIARRARSLRNYGQGSRYVHDCLGLNSRLDELQAAIMLSALLPRLDAWTERRRQIARTYCRCIENPAFAIPPVEPPGPVWHLFPVLVRNGSRSAFQAHMQACGISTGIHYPTVITRQEALRTYGLFEVLGPLTRAESLAAQEVSLPIHPYLTDSEVDEVVSASNSWRPA